MNLEDFLTAVRKRQATGEGIGLALPYLAGVAPCLGDGACQVRVFQMGSPEEWHRAVKEAENRLVYRDDDMTADGGVVAVEGGVTVRQVRPWGEKKPRELSPGACMDFEGVITSRKKDRDGDVLEAEGAEPDEKMPLLWQHIPMMPVGKLVAITNRSKNRVSGHFSIVDSELGRDSAQLVEFGALRLSHGFLPLEFEQLQRDENTPEHRFPGWHVIRFKILETSLVSVPSNEDAVITAFSRGKLFHPLVKAWAKSLQDQLPSRVVVPAGVPHKGGPIEIRLTLPDQVAVPSHKCGCGGGVKEEAPPEGYETLADFHAQTEEADFKAVEHRCRISDPSRYDRFRRGKRKHEGKEYGIVFGHPKDGGGWEQQSFRYGMDIWTPAEARDHCKSHDGKFDEAKPQESFGGGDAKGGQRIAKRNLDLLEEADELLGKALEEKEMPRATRALITSAQGNVKRVVKDGKREGEDGEEGKSLEVQARAILAGLLAGKSLSGSTLFALFQTLEPLKAGAEAEVRRAAEERIMREFLIV
jgi:hypothetical protein